MNLVWNGNRGKKTFGKDDADGDCDRHGDDELEDACDKICR